MKNNTPKMFRYGNIVNRIYFAISIVLMVIGLIAVIVGAVKGDEGKQLLRDGGTCFGDGVHLFVATILCNIFVINKAEKQIEEDFYRSHAPFINAIVFGVVSFNPFYVIAGIFGVILMGQKNNNPEQVEENKE